MADVEVSVCGLKLRNPVLPAAGPPGRNGAALIACARGGAGGLVSKTVSVTPARIPTPNMAEIRCGLLNTELWSEIPVEQWVATEYALAKESGLPLIIGLGYTADDIAKLAPRVRPFADAVELSTHYVGEDPGPMMDAIRAAKQALDVPVLVKLSPLGRNMVAAAQSARDAGADGLVLINSFGPCLALDTETGDPLLGGEGYGWLSGPAIKPLAIRCIFDVARQVNLPIFGAGGITRGIDAIEMFMAGASAVQVCTAAILQGPTILGKIAAEINSWLDDHDIPSIADIQGRALRRASERQSSRDFVHPILDVQACTGCGLCETSCVYGAIHVREHKATLDPQLCTGCGLCITRCRPRALRLH